MILQISSLSLSLDPLQDPESPCDAIETYTFYFEYSEDGEISLTFSTTGKGKKNSAEKTKASNEIYEQTVHMLRYIMQVRERRKCIHNGEGGYILIFDDCFQITQTMDMLPEEAYVTLKLSYYEDK